MNYQATCPRCGRKHSVRNHPAAIRMRKLERSLRAVMSLLDSQDQRLHFDGHHRTRPKPPGE